MSELFSVSTGEAQRAPSPTSHARLLSVFALCLIACGDDSSGGTNAAADGGGADGATDSSIDASLTCGNGALDPTEACDDGNASSGDGCSSACKVEVGWGCARPGVACVRVSQCGNAVLERGEECDSGASSDPGCVDCIIQDGYWCATVGQVCQAKVCGNGTRTPGEDCDDGNTNDGDGCSKACKVESGWHCSSNRCIPICGDGMITGRENCDDRNSTSGDGCSAGCVTEPGYNCQTLPCVKAVCGNKKAEGGEGCDDGNTIAGDGCGPTCQNEPKVVVGTNPVVQTSCGDGTVTSGEACDDGNKASGDGCSATCTVETGFACTESTEDPGMVQMKVTYRDFRGRGDGSGEHWHMKAVNDTGSPAAGLDLGIVGDVCTTSNTATCGRLDSEGKPTLDSRAHPTIHKAGDPQTAEQDREAFKLWYRDSNTAHVKGPTNDDIQVEANPHYIPPATSPGADFLSLTRDAQNVYTYENMNFFPLDGRGFGNTKNLTHNFHFTTELRYFFQYRGGETLTFFGDDDVWVFVNGRLAVDIGGIHGPETGRVVLGDDDSNCAVRAGDMAPSACSRSAAESSNDTDTRFGLTKGQVYEIVLFNAERHPNGSQFKLTLAGFLSPRSYCTPKCGDGIIAGWESCDSGSSNRDNTYGVCNTSCSHIDYCGDGIRQSDHEECDNGFNVDYTSGRSDACAPGCTLPPACGDGIVQAPNELCDKGAANDDTAYGGCTTSCTWGPFCGDGIINGDELCDEGENNVSASEAGSCGYDCKPAYILL